MPTDVGKTPRNQLDAIPLVTALAVADPGDIEIVSGKTVRHWSPSRTGINASHRQAFTFLPLEGQFFVGPTSALDFSGCTSFMFGVRRLVESAAANQLASANLLATPYMLGQSPIPTDQPDGNAGRGRLGQPLVGNFGNFIVSPAVPPFSQYAYKGCDNGPEAFFTGSAGIGTLVGAGWALWLTFGSGPADPNNEDWFLEVWAT